MWFKIYGDQKKLVDSGKKKEKLFDSVKIGFRKIKEVENASCLKMIQLFLYA